MIQEKIWKKKEEENVMHLGIFNWEKLNVDHFMEHWTAVSFCLELFCNIHQRSLGVIERATLQFRNQLLQPLHHGHPLSTENFNFSA